MIRFSTPRLIQFFFALFSLVARLLDLGINLFLGAESASLSDLPFDKTQVGEPNHRHSCIV